MTITEHITDLATRVRQAGADSPLVYVALRVAAQAWLQVDRAGADELRWGVAGTAVQDATDLLFPQPPATAVTIDAELLADEQECRVAIRQLLLQVAAVLHDGAQGGGNPRAWQYASAALTLRRAADDLT